MYERFAGGSEEVSESPFVTIYEITSLGRTVFPRAISRRATCAGGIDSLLGYSSGLLESFCSDVRAYSTWVCPRLEAYRVDDIFLYRYFKFPHGASKLTQVVMDFVEDQLLIFTREYLV